MVFNWTVLVWLTLPSSGVPFLPFRNYAYQVNMKLIIYAIHCVHSVNVCCTPLYGRGTVLIPYSVTTTDFMRKSRDRIYRLPKWKYIILGAIQVT